MRAFGLILTVLLPVLSCAARGVAAADPPEPTAPRPRLVLEDTEIDLGRVPEGETAVGVFTIRNAGEAELGILRAKAG